jgi:hypothetical protein
MKITGSYPCFPEIAITRDECNDAGPSIVSNKSLQTLESIWFKSLINIYVPDDIDGTLFDPFVICDMGIGRDPKPSILPAPRGSVFLTS